MLAIDANVIVRLLTGDDPEQAAKARRLLAETEVFVATTVLLETEWVLRGAYGLARSDVVAGLRAFSGLPNVRLENPARAQAALSLAEGGMDFADALHLAAAEGCDAFVTFDRCLAKAAPDPSLIREP